MSSLKLKTKAFLIHLMASAFVLLLFVAIVKFVWFPGPLFEIENVWQGLNILIPVDAVLGPLLTFIIYEQNKKRLKLDLAIIGFLQIAALVYGGYTIYNQRPVALAFVIDRFETVLASEKVFQNIPPNRFGENQLVFPVLTYVQPAQSDEERSNLVLNGINIKTEPKRHFPISEHLNKIESQALDLDKSQFTGEESKEVLEKLKRKHENFDSLMAFPLQSSTYESKVIILEKSTGRFLQYLDLDPWRS